MLSTVVSISMRFWRMIRRDLLWYVGIPLFVGALTYVPYLLIQCSEHMATCWRIPVAGKIIFDLNSYFTFISRAIASSERIVIGVFGSAIQAATFVFPNASVPEIWLLFRWIFGVLTWWFLAWFIAVALPFIRPFEKTIASVVWISVFLSMGFRPGIYSWFMPFMLISFGTMIMAYRFLIQAKVWKALGGSFAALIASIVYPWIFVTVVFWLGALWGAWILKRIRFHSAIFWTLLTLASIAISCLPVLFLPQETLRMLVETLIRNGMAFTRAPVISTLLVNDVMWAILLLGIRRRVSSLSSKEDEHYASFYPEAWMVLCIGWSALILAWLSNVFTGMYIQNDHFRMPMLIWIIITAAYICFVLVRSLKHEADKQTRRETWTYFSLGLIALIAVIKYVILERYFISEDQFAPLHVFAWLSLLIVALACMKSQSLRIFDGSRKYGILILCALCIGVPSYFSMFLKEARTLGSLRSHVAPAVAWIQKNIPLQERLCLGSEYDEQIASFSKRVSFFTLEDTCASMTDEELYHKVEIAASLAEQESASTIFPKWASYLRKQRLACSVFARERSFVNRTFGHDTLAKWQFGCDEATSLRDEAVITRIQSGFPAMNLEVKNICLHLVISSSSKQMWKPARSQSPEYDDGSIAIYKVQ